jgi:hypothetical protein
MIQNMREEPYLDESLFPMMLLYGWSGRWPAELERYGRWDRMAIMSMAELDLKLLARKIRTERHKIYLEGLVCIGKMDTAQAQAELEADRDDALIVLSAWRDLNDNDKCG